MRSSFLILGSLNEDEILTHIQNNIFAHLTLVSCFVFTGLACLYLYLFPLAFFLTPAQATVPSISDLLVLSKPESILDLYEVPFHEKSPSL